MATAVYYDIGRVHSFAQQIHYTDDAIISSERRSTASWT